MTPPLPVDPIPLRELLELEPGTPLICRDSRISSRDGAPTLVQGEAYTLREVRPIIRLDGDDSELHHYASGLGGDRNLVAVPKELFDLTLGELVNNAYVVVDGPTADGGRTMPFNVYPYVMFSR